MTNRYFALDAEGNVIPAGDHLAVRIENDLLARSLIVPARCAPVSPQASSNAAQ